MLVRDVMSRPAVTVRAGASLKEATTLLDARSLTTLPVVDSEGRVLGIVSEADLISGMVPRDSRLHLVPVADETHTLPPATVGEVMNLHPMTVEEDTDLAEATDLMTTTGVKSLPVLDRRGRISGVVSRRDVIHLLARPDTQIEAELDDVFRRLDRDWLVEVRDGIAHVTGPAGAGEHSMATTLAESVAGVTGVIVR
jgi:CBS-domain-containing membrane protein